MKPRDAPGWVTLKHRMLKKKAGLWWKTRTFVLQKKADGTDCRFAHMTSEKIGGTLIVIHKAGMQVDKIVSDGRRNRFTLPLTAAAATLLDNKKRYYQFESSFETYDRDDWVNKPKAACA
jgi:hypothetical protein